jgi:hypothetical protein
MGCKLSSKGSQLSRQTKQPWVAFDHDPESRTAAEDVVDAANKVSRNSRKAALGMRSVSRL